MNPLIAFLLGVIVGGGAVMALYFGLDFYFDSLGPRDRA